MACLFVLVNCLNIADRHFGMNHASSLHELCCGHRLNRQQCYVIQRLTFPPDVSTVVTTEVCISLLYVAAIFWCCSK